MSVFLFKLRDPEGPDSHFIAQGETIQQAQMRILDALARIDIDIDSIGKNLRPVTTLEGDPEEFFLVTDRGRLRGFEE